MATAEQVHVQLGEIAELVERAIGVAESYLSFVESTIAEMAQTRPDDAKSRYVWEMQRDRVRAFLDHLGDDTWDRLRELIDRTAVMEIARRGEFV